MRLCAPVTVKALESKSVDCSVEELIESPDNIDSSQNPNP